MTFRLVFLLLLVCSFIASISASEVCQLYDVALRLRGAVPDNNIHDALMHRSLSNSPLFRQHLDLPALIELVQASQKDIEVLLKWLALHDVSNITVGPTRDYIFFLAQSVDFVGEIPDAKPKTGRFSIAITSAEMARLIRSALVRCVSSNDMKKRVKKALRGSAGMTQNPLTISSRYGIPRSQVTNVSKIVQQAVAEFEQEQFYQSNVDAFNSRFGFMNQTISVLGPNKGGYFGEGNLDLEYINTLASGVETWWVAESEFDLVAWSQRLLTLVPPPSTLSISWGSGESGYDQQTVDAANAEFRKLGLLGLTVLTASGDQGTGSTGLFSCGTFDPTFPASSPYVTAVGGTYAVSASSHEIGWTDSGGGFSTFFPMPNYQNVTVQAYLANTTALPPSQYYTKTGRGIPDVSAVACNFETYSGGWGTESGTSAATPTFASIITRLNAERVSLGRPLLGFINPRLYELGKVGYDVVEGNNQNPSCPTGFPSRVGWDPVTGLGTPEYAFLRSNL